METIENLVDAINGLYRIVDNLLSAGEAVASIGCAILAIIALANCFFGYRLLKFWCSFNGGVAGLVIGLLVGNYLDIARPFWCTPSMLLAQLVLNIMLFAYLGFRIYKLGIFFTVGIPPLIVLLLLTRTAVLAIICSIIIGIIAVCMTRFVVIITSSIGYGMLAGVYIVGVFGSNNIGAGILIGTIVSVLGIIFQWKTTAISKEQKEAQRDVTKVTSLIRTKDVEEKVE